MTGKIFISYRRDDSIGTAGRLHDRLAQTFGRKNLFMDIDHIPAGVDFEAHLNSQLAECGVILVVIGSKWLKVKDKAGQRRLYQQGDFVAIEVAAALARNILVIPVLVDGTPLPKARPCQYRQHDAGPFLAGSRRISAKTVAKQPLSCPRFYL